MRACRTLFLFGAINTCILRAARFVLTVGMEKIRRLPVVFLKADLAELADLAAAEEPLPRHVPEQWEATAEAELMAMMEAELMGAAAKAALAELATEQQARPMRRDMRGRTEVPAKPRAAQYLALEVLATAAEELAEMQSGGAPLRPVLAAELEAVSFA
jgi:hypothetical protein